MSSPEITESITITPNDDINVVVMENDKLDQNTDTNISVRICAINMKKFNVHYTCPNCSSEIISDKVYVVCDNCHVISLLRNCQSFGAIYFTGQIANENILFESNRNVISKCFQVPVTPQKKFLSRGILNKDVDTVYQPKEKNIVPL